MPRKSGYVSKATKAKYAKRRIQTVRVVSPKKRKKSSNLGVGFPKKQTIHMRFVDQFTIDSNGFTTAQAFHGANNVNDPDSAIGGSRPLAWTEWNNFYNHYVVIRSKIHYTIFPIGNTASVPNMIGVYLADDVSTTLDYRTLAEQGRGMYKMVPTAATTKGPTHLYCSYNAKKFFNITDIKDNYDRLGAKMTSNPGEGAFYNLWCQPVDRDTDTQGYYVNVQIDYYVELSEPKELLAS